MTLAAGTRLGPYEIVAPLGAGGMGEVYRARDPRLGREVAIKVIPATLAHDRERLARFEQEARAAAALQHPGICTILELGAQDDAPFVVMELLEGETLRDRLRRGALPWRKSIEHAAAIARALAAAHEKGIIHRDLKPENLFLTKDGRVKVLDFGLAKLVHPDGLAMSGLDTLSMELTGSGVILGTAGYMAPEQVRGLATDARTDLFALGVVLYEMLTGARAFAGATFVETGNAILNHEPPMDSASGREIPAAVRRAVSHCLEKSPEQRFRSAGDLAFLLESLIGSDPAATATSPVRSNRMALSPVAFLLLAVALVAGAAGGAWVARRMNGAAGARLVHFPVLPPPGGAFQFGLEETKPFALSPDGGTLAFVGSDSSGARRIWLRPAGESEARSLTGTEGARSLFWSPDGRSLGFFSRRTLKRFDLGSSGVVNLCELPAEVTYSGSWGRDGTILCAGSQEGVIYRVPAAGGTPRPALRANESDGQSGCAFPEFLPDGRRFLYFMRRLDHRDSLMLGDLAGSSRAIMASASRAMLADAGTLLYVNDGTLVSQPFDAGRGRVTGVPVAVASGVSCFASSGGALFTASPGGAIAYQRASDRCRLARFDENGDEFGRVGIPADYLEGIDLSSDGHQLLSSRRRPGSGTWDIWQSDVVRGSESRLTTGSHVTEALPLWLTGERSFVYSSTSESRLPRLHRRDLTTGQVDPLLPIGGFQIADDVSSDGRLLLYEERRPPGVSHLWTLPLAGGEPRRLTAVTSGESGGRFSPDGHCVAMIADEGEGYELCVVPFPGPGERVRVSAHGADLVRWSRDGGRLYYLTPDGHMMVVPVRTSPGLLVGEPRVLFRIAGRPWRDFLITPDGRFLAMVPEVVQGEEPVDVVVGWKPGSASR